MGASPQVFWQQFWLAVLFAYFQYLPLYHPVFNNFQFRSNPDLTKVRSGLQVLYPTIYSNLRAFELLKNNCTVSILSMKGTSAKYVMLYVIKLDKQYCFSEYGLQSIEQSKF